MREYWNQLSAQEQRTVKWGAVVLVVLLFARFVWWPLSARIDRLHADIANEQSLIEWMKPTVALLKGAANHPTPVHHGAPGLSTIEKSLTAAGLHPFVKHLSQNASEQIILQVNNIPFDALIKCLEILNQQYGIAPVSLTANRQNTGVVDAEIVLRYDGQASTKGESP